MAIDKITPIRLDKSSDYKLVPKTSMVDALNMLITEDESDGGDVTTGNLGVLKNLKGNQVIEYVSGNGVGGENAKIIGSVTDTKLKIVYFFVWSNNINEHGVYAYDQLGKLPGVADSAGRIVRIHKSNLYNFPEHGFVKGNIVYTSQSRLNQNPGGPIKPGTEKDFEKDTILYFTDNTNEPRKINVYMAMSNIDNSYSLPDRIDFITACPKTPLTPIIFEFDSDQTRTTSNFKSGPGFQFAYQFISKDGVESAISPYSDIAFSPGVISQGTLTSVDHNTHNRCVLRIPEAGAEIESIRILARQFNNPELVVLDEVSNTEGQENWNPTEGVYFFYNDRIVKGVSTNEVNKQFDNLPRKAQAQAVVDNRLMYGNYLEGFNNVITDCSFDVIYEERPPEGFDFKLKLVPAVSQINDPDATGDDNEDTEKLGVNKCAGYIIDTGDVPNIIEPNTFITISLSISPDRNFHLYNAENSYHQSRHRGGFAQYEEEDINYSNNGTTINPSGTYGINNPYDQEGAYGHQNRYHSGEKWLEETLSDDNGLIATQNINGDDILWGIPYSGDNFGVTSNNGQVNDQVKWKTVLGESLVGTESVVTYGTSAGNPLILSGVSSTQGEYNFTFSCSFRLGANGVGANGDGKEAISNIVSRLLTGGVDAVTWGGEGFLSEVTVQNKHSHVIDLGIQNFDQIGKNDPENNLVTGVVQPGDLFEPFKPPIGHFIVNKATVELAFERDSRYSSFDTDGEMIRLVINSIEDVETVTVVKKIFAGSPWIALTKDYLLGNSPFTAPPTDDSFFTGVNLGGATMGPLSEENDYSDFKLSTVQDGMSSPQGIAGHDLYPILLNNVATNSALPFLGYLDFQQTSSSTNFFNFDRGDAYQGLQGLGGAGQELPLIGSAELFPFSLLDGEGGPGGELPYSYNDDDVNFGGSDYRSMSLYPGSGQSVKVAGPVFTGTINTRKVLQEGGGYLTEESGGVVTPSRTSLPLLLGRRANGLDVTSTSDFIAYSSPSEGLFNGPGDQTFSLNFSKKHSYVELLELNTDVGDVLDNGGGRTFKSSANHDFGIIYYDERGRHGFVNHLTTAYVPGYSSAERNSPVHGRSIIKLTFGDFSPPDWAHYYKIAYTKNTSVQNFVQYSAGGAFVENENASNLISQSNIYVSLNYLQESPISYVSDWGARSPEGGLSIFKHIPGVNQKLRIISSYVDQENRIWPTNYEFDVIDVVLLGDNDENPLIITGEGETSPEKIGEFVVLKNNPNAEGFDYAAVNSLAVNRWESNCIFEIYTPSKKMEDEERFYYEIGETYDVTSPGVNPSHSVTEITLDKGDVWWRKVPVNFRNYNEGEFLDLIQEDNESSSNFKPYYLETETASDLFKADATLIGRPNIILEDSVESIREASITYSGQSNPNSSKINYSSFNLTLSNFKDLQEEFGDINYMCNMEGDVFVIQSDRCTLVPASKTLFSDVSGTDTVAASKSPLGQERVFAGRAGCDNNPESVVQVGAFVYFAHKNLGKVYRFNPSSGVKEISDQGMASYFRGIFKNAISQSEYLNHDDVRVVGGFDPVNEEYLLTVLDPLTYGVIPSGGAGEFGGNEGDDSASSITVNSLEQQVRNILEAILTTEDDNGNLIFNEADLPVPLLDFYKGEEDLDLNDDGVFSANEVTDVAVIKSGLDSGISELIEGISTSLTNNDLSLIHDAITDTSVPETVDGVINYINGLISAGNVSEDEAQLFQQHINSITGDIQNLMGKLSTKGQSYFPYSVPGGGFGTIAGAFNSPSEFMNVFKDGGIYPLSEILQNASAVSDALETIQYAVANVNPDPRGLYDPSRTIYQGDDQISYTPLHSIDQLKLNGDFFTGFASKLGLIMTESVTDDEGSTLNVAEQFIADTFLSAVSAEALSNIQYSDISGNQELLALVFGNIPLDQIPEGLVTIIENAYLSGNENLDYAPSNPPLSAAILEEHRGDIVTDIIYNYTQIYPSLLPGLQAFMTNNNITSQNDLVIYIQALQDNETALNNFIDAYSVSSLDELSNYIQGLSATDQSVQNLLNSIDGVNTIGDLQGYIDNLAANQGEGYSSLEMALQAEGISISQLRNLIQQIAISEGTTTTTVMSDLNTDGSIGSADLIMFLTTVGTSTNIDYSQGYTDLNLN